MYKEQFIHLPKYKGPRSKFSFRPRCYTTLNVGDLVPIYKPIRVVPGDIFKFKTSSLLELTPMVSMVYDFLIFDLFCFYVPDRILWNDYKYFYGENKEDPYDSIGTYSIPQVKIPSGGYEVGTIANYFGVRPGVGSTEDNEIEISALPFRAYASIVNEFFIADYLDSKANTNFDVSATVTGSNGSNYISDLVLGGKPFKANKLHDRFTSCLPKPQAGPSVPLPLGDNAPVYASLDKEIPIIQKYNNPLRYGTVVDGEWDALSHSNNYLLGLAANDSKLGYQQTSGNVSTGTTLTTFNQFADLSGATATTVQDLRQAIIVQHLLESESRHGNKYFEQLLGDFGVYIEDSVLQRPEYLGGARFTINNNAVVQTSESGTTPQGNTASYSITNFKSMNFHKAFQEPGQVIILACVRYPHSYSQGLDKLWTQKDKFDFYNPHFIGLGEMPVYNHEIYFSGDSTKDKQVFGYMPYGTELRTLDNIATGEMSVDYAQSLNTFHYADDYDDTPSLSSSWLKEDVTNVDRTLDKPHSTVANFRCCFQFNIEASRPIDVHGIPGLRYL